MQPLNTITVYWNFICLVLKLYLFTTKRHLHLKYLGFLFTERGTVHFKLVNAYVSCGSVSKQRIIQSLLSITGKTVCII